MVELIKREVGVDINPAMPVDEAREGARRARHRLQGRAGAREAHQRDLRPQGAVRRRRADVRASTTRARCRRWPRPTATTRPSSSASSSSSTAASWPTPTASSTTRSTSSSGSRTRPRPRRRATPRPATSTSTTSGPSSTACRPPAASGIGIDRLVMVLADVELDPRGHPLPDAATRGGMGGRRAEPTGLQPRRRRRLTGRRRWRPRCSGGDSCHRPAVRHHRRADGDRRPAGDPAARSARAATAASQLVDEPIAPA